VFKLNLLNETLHEINNVDGVGRLIYVVTEINAKATTVTCISKYTLTYKHSRTPTLVAK
jgi:hypothetical protein